MKNPKIVNKSRGFALVVTLSLMILLTVIAVGLLTLSSVSLRSAAQGDAASIARANARMALMLAIGDLQRSMGPDQRISARAEILDTGTTKTENSKLTGAWNSWEIKATAPPSPSDYEKTARDQKFLGWLVSIPDPVNNNKVGYKLDPSLTPVRLWGAGTLGSTAPTTDFVTVSKIPVSSARGAVAWAVMDEGVKARINTSYSDAAATDSAKIAQLGSGERPGVEFIPGLKGLERKFFEKDASQAVTLKKGITRRNFGLAAEQLSAGSDDALKPLTHDVSTFSLGLFTDTAKGGMKQDFNLLTNAATLPASYLAKGVYASLLNLPAASAPSDPRWETLQQYSTLYRNKILTDGGMQYVKAQAPQDWFSGKTNVTETTTTTTVNRVPPPGLVLMPTIAKVQMLMSLVGRDLYNNLPDAPLYRSLTEAEKKSGMHGPQDGYFRSSKYDYDLHLLYAPVVTLHNPYNVALEFTSLRVEFIHVPFAMKVYRSGQAQSAGLIPMEQMTRDNENGQKGKTFGMKLKTKAKGKPDSVTVKLLPGEVKMFSPYIDPTLNYLNRNSFWDINLNDKKTVDMNAMPGWPGDGVGFDCDWLAGNQLVNQTYSDGHWGGCIGLAWDDQIYVEFAPLSLPISNNKFTVNMSATVAGSVGTPILSTIEMDYETPKGLQDFIGKNGVTMPMRYPKPNAVPNYIKGADLVDRCKTPIKSLQFLKAFALLSVQAKSTSGGRDISNIDGRLATKPWSFAHANIGASTQKVNSEHSANFSHEIDLQLLPGSPDDWIDIDLQDRSNFISGHTGTNGTKFGIQYEIPLAPLQALGQLNGANPGGSSGFLPRFAQPIGNSWAHPLIGARNLMETKSSGNYLDHSFLLNLALYDSFYFSGFADQPGASGTSGKNASDLAAAFASTTTTSSPLEDSRLVLHQPDGRPRSELNTEITKNTAYASIAGWQMMEGAFNINSTSVAAWKAMLASIHGSKALFNKLNKTDSVTSLVALPATDTDKARISRFRLPDSPSAATSADLKDAYWLGPREYSDAELQLLAENIVKQVRLRGPFLSMAEFVNRRLGAESDEQAQRGALQQAIDDSNLNLKPAANANAGFEIPKGSVGNYLYANTTAGSGPSYQGAPGYLSQADILNVLGNAATPRSDTFTIRGYGETRDATGKTILAAATCEAVVQRIPEWLDPIDPVATIPASLVSQQNIRFGRRFIITSFRWLNTTEI